MCDAGTFKNAAGLSNLRDLSPILPNYIRWSRKRSSLDKLLCMRDNLVGASSDSEATISINDRS